MMLIDGDGAEDDVGDDADAEYDDADVVVVVAPLFLLLSLMWMMPLPPVLILLCVVDAVGWVVSRSLPHLPSGKKGWK